MKSPLCLYIKTKEHALYLVKSPVSFHTAIYTLQNIGFSTKSRSPTTRVSLKFSVSTTAEHVTDNSAAQCACLE